MSIVVFLKLNLDFLNLVFVYAASAFGNRRHLISLGVEGELFVGTKIIDCCNFRNERFFVGYKRK